MSNNLGNSNVLNIGGVPCDLLAKACGTPLYIYDEQRIIDKFEEYKNYFKSDIFNTEIIYASKAFSCKAMLQLVHQNDCSVDVVSGGELYLAKESGIPMEKVFFHGNNKTYDELAMALLYGCKTIIVDNLMECEMILDLTKRLDKGLHVLIRVNPDVSANTHKYIITGNSDSKFGVLIHNEDTIIKMINMLKSNGLIKFDGFHSHIGSQIFDLTVYETVIERLMGLIKKLEKQHNINIGCLNLGGGFGVCYTDEDNPKSIEEICSTLITKCESEIIKNDLKIEKIMIEPGRSVVAEAGCTLYSIGFKKNTENKSYLFVDGGMTDNMRVALYGAKYDCDLANKIGQQKINKYTIAGKCCESGDILIEDTMLPIAESKDLLVVYGTGAYGYAMANNYNKMRKPAVVFVKEGKARIVIRRESYEDLMSSEINEEVVL